MSIEFNDDAIRQIEQQAADRLAPIEAEANAAMSQHDTAEAKAEAFAAVMQAHGIDVDRDALLQQIREQMND